MREAMPTFTSYNDVSDIFNRGRIWTSGYEKYWYQYAWSILVEQNLTCYSTSIEEYKIMFYAFALVDVYQDFCCETFGEYHSDIYDIVQDFLPEVIIGQVAAGFLTDGDAYEEARDAVDAIITAFKKRVFKALSKKITATDAFVWMYCTGETFYKTVLVENDDPEEEEEYEEIAYDANSIDEYADMVKNVYVEVVNDCDYACQSGFDYLREWMK